MSEWQGEYYWVRRNSDCEWEPALYNPGDGDWLFIGWDTPRDAVYEVGSRILVPDPPPS